VFIKEKFSRFRHKHPKLLETDIYNKITREWEDLTPEEKERVIRVYQERGLLGGEKEAADAK
jgi:hypothetical protein